MTGSVASFVVVRALQPASSKPKAAAPALLRRHNLSVQVELESVLQSELEIAIPFKVQIPSDLA